MPREYRRIEFSHEEIRDILDAYVYPRDRGIPTGRIVKLEIVDLPGKQEIEIHFQEKPLERVARYRVDPLLFTEGLLQWCLAAKVPLPRQSEKRLLVIGGVACLDFMVDTARVLAPTE